jgi:two-component system chemotaxis sensor kinase CheA
MNALHDQFVAEARDLIQQATDDLMAAEREGFSDDRIDRVFRAFHTLKGSAGVVDLPSMGLVLHAAEDVLAAIQAGRIGAASSLIDMFLVCLDQVASWVDAFEAGQSLPPDAGGIARTLSERLRSSLVGPSSAARTLARESADHALPTWVADLLEAQGARLRLAPMAAQYSAFSYRPRAGCFFDGDDPVDLVRRVPNLVAFSANLAETPQTLADVDPYVCNLRLDGIAAATQADLAAVFRLVPDQVSILELPVTAISIPSSARVSDDATALAHLIIEEQVELLDTGGDVDGFPGRAGSAIRATIGALRHSGREDLVDAVEQAGSSIAASADASALRNVLETTLRMLVGGAGGQVQGSGADGAISSGQALRAQGRSLRVDEARVDALVDLAGELLVATHGVAHLAKRAETEDDRHALARAIDERKEAMDRIAAAIHEAALQLRMVPVAQVFRSFPRAVRDLARQLGKDVTFVTLGDTTEADKTIADQLFEPIMHLIRNALDHGIEAADQRRAAAKELPARLTLRATRAGDRLIVEVTDDGGGIDPQVVRRKAREKRLMPDDELDALSDEQAIDLVFAAGFSTAADVSAVSGRGVGMDVVRSTVERMGGRVAIRSQARAGTTVTLDFPVKIALLRIMVVETGGQLLGIPMDAVLETVRLTPDRISRFKTNDGFVLHDRVVPICSLAELLGLRAGEASRSERLVVVAEVGGRRTALEVDAVRERLEVVLKPLQGLLSKARGYAGTTLLGDGAVLLVLDLKEILP